MLQNRRHRPIIWTFSHTSEWWDAIVPGFTHTQWVHNFRMSEETFLCFCAKLHSEMEKHDTNFRVSVPLKKRVAIALWKLATNSDYRSIGHLFGVSKTTSCRCVQEPPANYLFQNRFVFLTSKSLKKWRLTLSTDGGFHSVLVPLMGHTY